MGRGLCLFTVYNIRVFRPQNKENTMFKVGDKVVLRPDVLQRHSRSVPAHMGYTREQFAWRDTLRELLGKNKEYKQVSPPIIGTVSRVFANCITDSPQLTQKAVAELPQSKHTNVDFPNGHTIGIDNTELLRVCEINGVNYPYDETTQFVVQVGRGSKGSYRNRYTCPGKPTQAVLYFNGINIGLGYKKRLLVDKKVIARAFS
jgi:hypothetical protein